MLRRDGKGGENPRAPSHYGGAKSLLGAPNGGGGRQKCHKYCTSIQYICFRNT